MSEQECPLCGQAYDKGLWRVTYMGLPVCYECRENLIEDEIEQQAEIYSEYVYDDEDEST